ncbi:hypothetical protein C725_0178 [Pacificimonas flava]|uniref:Uncharacterized protein n=1 Tax=Pacificimonas flava TaxID=1234595 RepID=M2U8E0_9SPHN|nr:hypothetical protein C725_0178 [Pacificimonas flava]
MIGARRCAMAGFQGCGSSARPQDIEYDELGADHWQAFS